MLNKTRRDNFYKIRLENNTQRQTKFLKSMLGAATFFANSDNIMAVADSTTHSLNPAEIDRMSVLGSRIACASLTLLLLSILLTSNFFSKQRHHLPKAYLSLLFLFAVASIIGNALLIQSENILDNQMINNESLYGKYKIAGGVLFSLGVAAAPFINTTLAMEGPIVPVEEQEQVDDEVAANIELNPSADTVDNQDTSDISLVSTKKTQAKSPRPT